MARGNQRDKAREKNQKKLAEQKGGNKVCVLTPSDGNCVLWSSDIRGGFRDADTEQMSGSELSKAKEDAASIMRAKQAAGKLRTLPFLDPSPQAT